MIVFELSEKHNFYTMKKINTFHTIFRSEIECSKGFFSNLFRLKIFPSNVLKAKGLKAKGLNSKFLAAASLIVCLIAAGCEPEQKIPAYIYIPKMKLVTNSATEGTDSAKLIDAWVYSNDSLIAGVRLPATVPIIGYGNTRISVLAGIAENGNFANPAIYPFFDKYEKNLANRPGKADTLHPVFHYNSLTQFPLIENFTLGNAINNEADGDTMTTMIVTNESPLSPPNCAKIALDGVHTLCKVSSNELPMPTGTSQIWVELSYRNNNTFSVGAIGYKNGVEFASSQEKVVLAKYYNTWNRTYINLTQELRNVSATSFKLVITVLKDGGVASPQVFLDDIKIVRF
ncbi:MAG: hypothetical protein RI894_2493 [Bacteroidota bacterium]|jgi:hypothetical protein